MISRHFQKLNRSRWTPRGGRSLSVTTALGEFPQSRCCPILAFTSYIGNISRQIDIPCRFVKCGYAGSHFPAHIFPSMVSTTELHLDVFICPSFHLFYQQQNRKHLFKTSIISLQVGRPIIRAATRVDDVEVLHHHPQPYPSLP